MAGSTTGGFAIHGRIVARDPYLLGATLKRKVEALRLAEEQAATAAATLATDTTRNTFQNRRRSDAPARRGRLASGQMRAALLWKRDPVAGGVVFDTALADSKAKFWIIQEIGTSESATLRRGGQKNPRGRPKSGATYVKAVKSQIGRRIPRSLAFGTAPGGAYTPFGAATGQQLYLRSQLTGAPPMRGRRQPVITREIKGQHMVRFGGEAGFGQYRPSVLAAARRAFAGHPRRP